MFEIKVIRDCDEQSLSDILTAYRASSPWSFSEVEDYFREMLRDTRNVHVILKDNGAPAGYVMAKPHDEAVKDEELLAADPLMEPDPERYYIETASISEKLRRSLIGGKMFFRMLETMIAECKERFGINKFSMHLRVGNGASSAVQRCFSGMLTPLRRIEKWPFYNGEDDADYLEGTYTR